MGFGKLALSLMMICILAFAFVTAFAMAGNDVPKDAYLKNDSSANRTITVANTVTGATANLMLPLVAISGIVCLCGAFLIFRRVR